MFIKLPIAVGATFFVLERLVSFIATVADFVAPL